MKIVAQNLIIEDYIDALKRGDIVINREYQRSNQVWPDMAKSYLMETIIRDFPIPKLFLHQTQDKKTGRSVKHIVDGQQRTQAIIDFYDDKFSLSRSIETEDLRGLKFSELDDDARQAFLNYGLSMDLFTAAPIEQVIEVFRRMNSYTVPLNPEEKRHAVWQGAFKWFVNRIARSLQPSFREIGAFSEKQIFRMADAKLLTEICHAVANGIETTNARKLDTVYKEFDREFKHERDIEQMLMEAFGEIIGWEALHNGSLMKPYQLYSLVLAIMHVRHKLPVLQPLFHVQRGGRLRKDGVVQALSSLAHALEVDEEDDDYDSYAEFILASTSKTNVKKQRETRFVWYCKALTGKED